MKHEHFLDVPQSEPYNSSSDEEEVEAPESHKEDEEAQPVSAQAAEAQITPKVTFQESGSSEEGSSSEEEGATA